MRVRSAILIALAAAMAIALALLPPIQQARQYHLFADSREILGIPNFWNVVSNLPFLGVAVWGLGALRSKRSFTESWERAAFGIVLAGTALVAFGSGYYHWNPDSGTLFWDRLPMTVVFMALFAAVIGERAGMRSGRRLLAPLLVAGGTSVVYWRVADDLRPYVMVQFYPLLAIPLMLLLFRPRYSGTGWMWAMCALYGAAKVLELADRQIAILLATGGHPWKHVVAAGAMACYVTMIRRRRPLPIHSFDNTCPPSVL
jgi:Ceramidase